jgi:hypothetical protein
MHYISLRDDISDGLVREGRKYLMGKMKSLSIFIAFLLGGLVLCPAGVAQAAGKSDEALLENIDAMQAVAIANEWKWTKKDVKTSIDSREVIFEFPDGKVKRIALPKDKMYIAIAPYIEKTHT